MSLLQPFFCDLLDIVGAIPQQSQGSLLSRKVYTTPLLRLLRLTSPLILLPAGAGILSISTSTPHDSRKMDGTVESRASRRANGITKRLDMGREFGGCLVTDAAKFGEDKAGVKDITTHPGSGSAISRSIDAP